MTKRLKGNYLFIAGLICFALLVTATAAIIIRSANVETTIHPPPTPTPSPAPTASPSPSPSPPPTPEVDLVTDKTEYDAGDTVTLTATLSFTSDRVVDFFLDDVKLGSAPSSGGVAVFTTVAVNSGTEDVTAVWHAEISV